MKRYLSECQDGHSGPGALQLQRQYQASVTLTAQGLSLVFDIAQIFVGPPGPKALPILLIDPTRPVAYAASETTIYRMDYSAGLPTFAVHATASLATDWPNRTTLAYTEAPA
jgi:hypothetical protein